MQEPKKGFYYHYKHDPKGSINNYAYEVLNVAWHTEMEGTDPDSFFVIYQPIYESRAYKLGKYWYARPLIMFMEDVVKEGKEMKRFTLIIDPKVIEELEKIKKEMYGEPGKN